MAEADAPDSRPPIETFLIEFGKKFIDGEIVTDDADRTPTMRHDERREMLVPLEPERPRLPRAVAQDVEFSRAQDQARRSMPDHSVESDDPVDVLAPYRGLPAGHVMRSQPDD
jgi:hypothetical protein